jgi:hypothetical protein
LCWKVVCRGVGQRSERVHGLDDFRTFVEDGHGLANRLTKEFQLVV